MSARGPETGAVTFYNLISEVAYHFCQTLLVTLTNP